MGWGRLLRLRWAFWLVLGFSGFAAALTLSPEVQRGVTWLQAKVTSSGALDGEADSVATPLQNRDEALRTLQLLAAGNAALAGAIASDDPSATENLARQALSLAATQDISPQLAALAARQNADGGVGTVQGAPSSPLDSAWALAALSSQAATYGTAIGGLKTYLIGQQWDDGGLAGLSQNARVEGSSLMLLALQALTPDLDIRNSMQKLGTWLSQSQGIDGSWGGDLYMTAYALAALTPVSADGTQRQTAVAFLKANQGPNGDWAADPFLTAVILRALSATPSAATSPATNGVAGQVLSSAGNLPLSGVAVTIGGTSLATTTDAQGKFQLANVPTSSQTLTFAAAGYQSRSYTITVPSTSQLDMGTVLLSPASASATTLSGTVMDVDTQQPVAGVTLALNSVPAVSVQTDSTGHYQISNLSAGTYGLGLSATGYSAQSLTIGLLSGSNVLQISMRKQSNPTPLPTGPASLSGQVVALGSAQPLADVQVLVNQQLITATSASGAFSLVLPAGTYRLDYQKAGYLPLTQNVAVTDGSTVSLGQVALTAQRTTTLLSGVVTDAATQKAIPNATVQVIDGASTTTDANGHYVIDGIQPSEFDVRATAGGYDSAAVRLSVSFPGEVGYDFALTPQAGQGVSIAPLGISPQSVGLRTDVTIAAQYQNAGSAAADIVPTLQVLNRDGLVVAIAVPYSSATGAVPLGPFTLAAGASQAVYFRWNSGQFAPGAYTVVARASATGTMSRTNLLGMVLAERQAGLAVTAGSHLSGSATATPPVQQAGSPQPVHITSVLQNDGNTASASQTLTARIADEKTGAVVYALPATVPSLQVNELATLDFGTWSSPATGSYLVSLVDASGAPLGITTKVYVGDAAKGFFTVNKTVVPTGNQTVKANVALQGVDPATGEITNPLAPVIKSAIQRAVTYNDANASAWVTTNGCAGCHIAAQAMVGGETNNKVASYDLQQRKTILSSLLKEQADSGYFSASGVPKSETALAAWALNSTDNDKQVDKARYGAMNYLMSVQDADGGWTDDYHPEATSSLWWTSRIAQTAINAQSLAGFAARIRANPDLQIMHTETAPDLPAFADCFCRISTDSKGNLYVAHVYQGYVEKITPTGQRSTVVSGRDYIYYVLVNKNGDMYLSERLGIERFMADGRYNSWYTGATTYFAEGPNGEVYTAVYGSNRMGRFNPDGSSVTCGTIDPYPNALTVGRNGTPYVAMTWGGIYKVESCGTQVRVGSYPAGYYLNDFTQYPDGRWAVTGTNGIFIMSEDFSVVLETANRSTGTFSSLLRNGLLYFTTGDGIIKRYASVPMSSTDILPRMDASILKAKSWLLSNNPYPYYTVRDWALQIVGLTSVQGYLGVDDPAVTSKVNGIAATLRSVQATNGSWGDVMTTAQVGYALDRLNPSPDDPALAKAINWTLSQEQADGSWHSPLMGTNVAATTWVAIWLPQVLNQIGGIDTDLHLTLPPNIHLGSPTLAPTDATTGSDGSHYHWKLVGVTGTQRNIGFDLALDDLLPGEQRPVAADAHLTFNNSFTNSQVSAPLAIPVVSATNGLGLTLATDQGSYGANSAVGITANVANASADAQNGTVHLWVYAQDGTLVSDLGAQPFTGLAPSASQALSGSWNTALYLPNSYYVMATLYDAAGHQVSTQRQDFVITASTATGRLLSAQVTTDKGSYGPWDTVQLTDRVVNLTQNALVGDLHLTTRIMSSANQVVWTHVDGISQITAGSLKDLMFAVPLANAPAGTYSVTLAVADSNGVVQAQSSASYLVQSTATTGAGLSGTLALSQRQVIKGDTETISVTLSNQGNALLEGLPVTISIVDPVRNAVVAKWLDTVPSLSQGGTANLSHGWVTQGSYGTNLVAVLTTGLTGTKALAQGVFTLIKPPLALTYASDKATYDVNDTAVMASAVRNGAPMALANLGVVQQVTRPDGSVLWTATLPGQSLAVGGTLTHVDNVPVGQTPPGQYLGTLSVLDGDGIVLASTTTAFEVRSTAVSGVGLAGSVSAAPAEVPLGTEVALGLSLSNNGNADLLNLPVQLVVTEAGTGQVATSYAVTLTSLLQGGTQTRSFAWTPTGKAGTSYQVSLQYVLNGATHALATTTFKLAAPAIKLDIQPKWGGQGRLLVYLSCQPDWQLADPAWTYGQHQDACFAQRTATLKGYLDALNVSYTIVTESDDFQREFRSGRYNRYWLLGAVETLKSNTIQEIREAVFRGDSLLADGGIQRWNNATLYPLLGVTYKGQQSCTDVPVNFATPIVSAATAALGAQATAGRPLTLQPSTGVIGGRIASGACAGAPAVLGNTFGRGKTLALAFDLVGSLPTASTAAPWLAVLGDGLAYTAPLDNAPSAVVPGEYLRYAVTVTNQARAANLLATVQLPTGSTLMATVPTATVNADGSLSYRFTLPENGVQLLDTQFRAPLLPGNYTAAAAVRVDGSSVDYGSVSLPFSVLDPATRAAQVRSAMASLPAPPKSQDKTTLKQALGKFDLAQQHYAQGQLAISLNELADTADLLGQLTQTNATDARVALDWLLHDREEQWWRECGVLAPDQRDTTRCLP